MFSLSCACGFGLFSGHWDRHWHPRIPTFSLAALRLFPSLINHCFRWLSISTFFAHNLPWRTSLFFRNTHCSQYYLFEIVRCKFLQDFQKIFLWNISGRSMKFAFTSSAHCLFPQNWQNWQKKSRIFDWETVLTRVNRAIWKPGSSHSQCCVFSAVATLHSRVYKIRLISLHVSLCLVLSSR